MLLPAIHHLFLSYSRVDNEKPVNADGEGWVTAFVGELSRRHAAYSGRKLEIFFDQQSIEEGTDWRRRLGEGLRQSRLFLAFLSPNYLTSKNCLWERDEYLRREHSAARGDNGLTPIFFVTPDDLRLRDDQAIADWLAAMERKYAWFKARATQLTPETEQLARPFVADLGRRQNKAELRIELHPWFERGPEVLRELDAAARSADTRIDPRDPGADLRTLAERLAGLDRHIARRLDRIALADLAPGNIPRSHEHFVGRHRELRELHDIMLGGGSQSGGRGMGGRGMIAAAFSPGGLGKTALARQYAHAYAEFYAAGGTWEIPCEGLTEVGAALLRLENSEEFKRAAILRFDVDKQRNVYLTEPLILGDAERSDYPKAAEAILAYLRRVTEARVAVLREQLRLLPERHCPENDPPELRQPRSLLILDNVDRPELLSATQIAQLPATEWLEIIVTTRLDPNRFGGGDRTFAHVEVSVLPEADAVRLLADFQPEHRFANATEEDTAHQIARALGGYTLAIELVAAYLGHRAREGYQPSEYLPRLEKEGLVAPVDALADDDAVKAAIRHSTDVAQNHVATLVRWSLDRLSPPARMALEFASLLMPDEIPLHWLERLTRARHPEAFEEAENTPPRWPPVWRELRGLRLLHPAREIEVDDRGIEQMPRIIRIHRLVAQHVAAADPDGERTFGDLDRFLYELAGNFEQQVGQTEDENLRRQHPWLRDQLAHLIGTRPPTPSLLRSAQVAADFEGQHGSLARGLTLFQRILAARERQTDSNENRRSIAATLATLGDFLARRGKPDDAKQALAHYSRCLAVGERLLGANPDSAQAARDVSVSLDRLGDFLADRGKPGDAEQALVHHSRCLAVRERLLDANPDSAQAARDVSVSLERVAAFEGKREGGAVKALELQTRALQIALGLREANPESVFYGRAAAVSFFLTFQRAQAAGNEELAHQCLAGCYSVLDSLVQASAELDPPMRQLHAQLQSMFHPPGTGPSPG